MRVVDFSRERGEPIERFESVAAQSVHVGDGEGEAHVYAVHFDAGGSIGRHPAGFGQLFLVTAGSGWVAGEDGTRVELAAGQGAYIARGETHSKGSEAGMSAIMVQVHDLQVRDPQPRD
jgi:quercetin dioxygenase-like cupin family protein